MGTQCATTMKGMWFCPTRRLWFVGPGWKVNLGVLRRCPRDSEQGKCSPSLPRTKLNNKAQALSEQGAVSNIPDRDCPQLAMLVPWFAKPDTGVALSSFVLKSRLGQVKPPFPFSSPSYLLSLQGEWTQKNVSFRGEHFHHDLSIVPEQGRRNIQMPIFSFGGRSERKPCPAPALHPGGSGWWELPLPARLEECAQQGDASLSRQDPGFHGLPGWSTHTQAPVRNKSTEPFSTSHRWVNPLWRSLQTCEIRMTCLEFCWSNSGKCKLAAPLKTPIYPFYIITFSCIKHKHTKKPGSTNSEI